MNQAQTPAASTAQFVAGDLAVRTQGLRGERILWVHGYTMDSSLWSPLWQRLAEFTHHSVDLPGHGETTRAIPTRARLTDFSRAVAEAADACDAHVILGLSFGATVALQAALDRPRRYAGLLLAALGLAGGPQDREAADCNLELMRMARERGLGPWLARRWLQVPPRIFEGVARDPALHARVAGVVQRHTWAELSNDGMVAMAQARQSLKQVATISAPAFLLVGEDDMPAFQRSAHLVKSALPRATCDYAPHRGHLPLLESPDEGAAWVRKSMAHIGAR